MKEQQTDKTPEIYWIIWRNWWRFTWVKATQLQNLYVLCMIVGEKLTLALKEKQRHILKNCEEHRWEIEGAGFLFAAPWEECCRCLHALEHAPEQREATVCTHHHQCIQASEDCLCYSKRKSLSLGSSCRNETKCNKILVVCARSHGGLSRDC